MASACDSQRTPLLKAANFAADTPMMADPNRGAKVSAPTSDQSNSRVWAAILAAGMLIVAGCATEEPTSETAARITDEGATEADDGADGSTTATGDGPEDGGTQIVPDAVPGAADPVRGCTAVEAPEGVNVNWWGLPAEADLSVIGNRVTLATTADRPDGVLTLFGAETASGDLIEMRFTTAAAAESINCELSAPTDEDQPADTSSCAPAESTAQDCDSPTFPYGDKADELTAARDHFQTTAFGPHAYFITSIDGVEEDLYLQADGQGGRSFVPPKANAEFLNPSTIHDELLAAIGAGATVAYQLDPTSGLPVWWTVDGQTTKLLCFELDTAPPELRVGPCDPATDLIDR